MAWTKTHDRKGERQSKDREHVRVLLGLFGSALLHALPVLLGLIPALALRVLPKPPIEFELLPPKPRPAAAAPAPSPVPERPPPAATPPKPGAGKSEAERLRPAAKNQPPAVQRLDLSKERLNGIGPDAIEKDLGLRMLLRMPALRQSPHRSTVEALLQAFPDTHILAAGTALATPVDPAGTLKSLSPGPMALALVKEVDALFIATADPRDITATVFYALLPEGATLAEKLSARHGPRWDPRNLYVLRKDLLAFARPDLLSSAAPEAPATAIAPEQTPSGSAASGEDGLLSTLRQPGPALYAEILNVRQRLRLGGGLPTPVAIRLALSADADPEVHARVELSSAGEVAQLVAALPGIVEKLSSQLFWVGLGSLLKGLKFQARGLAVEINGRLPGPDTTVLLAWLRQFLPPPDRFLDPPPPPPPSVSPSAPPSVVPSVGFDLGAPSDAAPARRP